MGHTDHLGRNHLALDTCKMRHIDNYQTHELTRLNWEQAAEQFRRYRNRLADFVGPASPIYNCHGLTFAARRTQVDGSSHTIHWILEEDGYALLEHADLPRPGDVVIYYDEMGQVEHSGIVVWIPKEPGFDKVPRVWSKWGKAQEVVHAVNDCPYNSVIRYFRREPWRPVKK